MTLCVCMYVQADFLAYSSIFSEYGNGGGGQVRGRQIYIYTLLVLLLS